MKAINVKLLSSAMIIVMIVTVIPLVGLTESSADCKQGLVLDFGYWDSEWIEMTFTDGMDGYDVVDTACHIKGYEIIRLSDGSVYSLNGEVNLVGVQWKMYVLSGAKWIEKDPEEINASDYKIITWARSSGSDSLVPGTDYSGFTYYSYAENGIYLSTGEKLKVVALAPSVTETVAAVGGIEYITGTDLYSDYPQAIVDGHSDGSIAITGGYTDPNYEWIVNLNPDIVFCDGSVGQQVTIADKLRKSGIDCVVLYDAVDIDAMYDNIWIVASALGFSGNANQVIQELRSTINGVSGIAGETGTRAFVALSADPSPWTAGSYTFISDLISSVGGINIFDSQSSSWFMVSKEQIYAKQPQVIMIIISASVTTDEEYQEIIEGLDPIWKETPAYKNNDIYIFSGVAADILSRPGPRLAEATELLAKILNPDAFLDLDQMDAIPKYFSDDYQLYLKYQAGEIV